MGPGRAAMSFGFSSRSAAALVVAVIAAVASVASLDEAAPFRNYTDSTPQQSVVLDESSPQTTVKLHATSTDEQPITLTIRMTASWNGFADGGAGDYPIVEASVAAAGATTAEGAETLDRAITTAPGTGELILSAEASSAPARVGADFVFTLDRIEPVRSGPVTVSWTAEARISSDAVNPTVSVAVIP